MVIYTPYTGMSLNALYDITKLQNKTDLRLSSVGSVMKDPTKKSRAASMIIMSSANCSFTTHFTPATLIVPSSSTAAMANPRDAHLCVSLSGSATTKPAIDSPKPNTFKAQPTAWKV